MPRTWSRHRRLAAAGLIGASMVGGGGASAEVPARPTFTRDIAPIFQNKCEACHRPDSIAPMALRTYQEARPNTIKASEGFFVLRQAARVESFQPHMHLRGKAMSMEVILPNGQTHVLSHVANFTFNWHTAYIYADHAAPLLPRGSVIKITAWHDNTAANKANPDPNVWVGYGDRTVDEMGHAWVNLTYLSDADYLAEVEMRKAQLRAQLQAQRR